MNNTLSFSYLEIPENKSNTLNKMKSLSQFTSVEENKKKEEIPENKNTKVTDDDVEILSKNMQGEEKEDSKESPPFHKPKCKSKSSLGSLDEEDCEEEENDDEDESPNIESFNANQEDKKYFVPYYNRVANEQNIDGIKDQVNDKLNYLIHILEEQQNEKTDQVTEELLLYFFLGVFIKIGRAHV